MAPLASHISRSAASATLTGRQALAASQVSPAALSLRHCTGQAYGRAHQRAPGPSRRCSVTAAATSATEVPAAAAAPSTVWDQKTIRLPSKPRGCHVMTRDIAKQVPEIGTFEVGMANFFLLHTSASLTINENASSDVPLDLTDALDKLAPEGEHYRHLDEGYDDMPAHVKSSLMGASLDIPISQGRLALGTWQGIYLNEHRNHGGARSLVVTLQGKLRPDGKSYAQYR